MTFIKISHIKYIYFRRKIWGERKRKDNNYVYN